MLITPLGGGSEVGRSCVHLSFTGRKVLVSIPETLARPHPFPSLSPIGPLLFFPNLSLNGSR